MQPVITLSEINIVSSASLAELLMFDDILSQQLGNKYHEEPITPDNFFNDLKVWQTKTNSNSYVITLGDRHIGLISLSHQSDQSAKIGYWLASAQWHKGYASRAFALMLSLAMKRGFTTVSATIDPKNIASIKIWSKAGSNFENIDGQLIARLRLVD